MQRLNIHVLLLDASLTDRVMQSAAFVPSVLQGGPGLRPVFAVRVSRAGRAGFEGPSMGLLDGLFGGAPKEVSPEDALLSRNFRPASVSGFIHSVA